MIPFFSVNVNRKRKKMYISIINSEQIITRRSALPEKIIIFSLLHALINILFIISARIVHIYLL